MISQALHFMVPGMPSVFRNCYDVVTICVTILRQLRFPDPNYDFLVIFEIYIL